MDSDEEYDLPLTTTGEEPVVDIFTLLPDTTLQITRATPINKKFENYQ